MAAAVKLKVKRAAMYARYSSTLQNDSSIDGQLAMCRQVAARENLRVVATFCDRAKTGASMQARDGLIDCLAEAKAGKFDVLIVDNLDRLARDQEDLPRIFKRLNFADVQILTVHEGYATKMHIGMKGMTGSIFLDELARNVKRGHLVVLQNGKVPGSIAYGYKAVFGYKGMREIDEPKAKIVRRIFREYADGVSPRVIAKQLTDEGVPPPRHAGSWTANSFIGGGLRKGMIGNPIYAGRLEWNRTKSIENPETGKKIKRAAAASEIVITQMPKLRIVDQRLYDAANAVRIERGEAHRKPGAKKRPNATPGGAHPLAGLLQCGACNGPMRIAAVSRNRGPRAACTAGDRDSACAHRRSYDMGTLLDGVLDHMRTRMAAEGRKLITDFVQAFHAQAEDTAADRKDAAAAAKKLARVDDQIARIVEAISTGNDPVPALVKRLDALQAERGGHAERLRQAESKVKVVTLHPRMIEHYMASLRNLHDAISGGQRGADLVRNFQALFHAIVVHPTPARADYEFSVFGRLGAIADAADANSGASRPSKKARKVGGTECWDSGDAVKAASSESYHQIIPFGRWQAGAYA